VLESRGEQADNIQPSTSYQAKFIVIALSETPPLFCNFKVTPTVYFGTCFYHTELQYSALECSRYHNTVERSSSSNTPRYLGLRSEIMTKVFQWPVIPDDTLSDQISLSMQQGYPTYTSRVAMDCIA